MLQLAFAESEVAITINTVANAKLLPIIGGMKNILVSLFLIFTLFVAPVAHAAGIDCEVDGCNTSEHSEKKSSEKKQDEGKAVKIGHVCICSHISAKLDSHITEILPALAIATAFKVVDEKIPSFLQGPVLKPPSLA